MICHCCDERRKHVHRPTRVRNRVLPFTRQVPGKAIRISLWHVYPVLLGVRVAVNLLATRVSVSECVGRPFAVQLTRAGVGVQVRSVPVRFLDGDLFDRLGDA